MTSLCLVGSHASTAMSPQLWTRAFALAGLNFTYDAWEVPEISGLGAVEHALRARRVTAANVTMPYKSWAVSVADVADDDAAASGVGNLLLLRDGVLIAQNTDIAAVRTALGERKFGSVLLLGAGGAAHAAVFALRGRVRSLDVADADPAASASLVTELAGRCGTASSVDWARRAASLASYDLVINATPIGRDGSEDQLPWGAGDLKSDAVVYDFVYAEHENAVERYAVAHRIELIDGWTHLYHQAAAMIEPLGLPRTLVSSLQRSVRETRTRESVVVSGSVLQGHFHS